ncbi:hypothetical protein GCM10023079_13950 [Streptomyces chitinivorans]
MGRGNGGRGVAGGEHRRGGQREDRYEGGHRRDEAEAHTSTGAWSHALRVTGPEPAGIRHATDTTPDTDPDGPSQTPAADPPPPAASLPKTGPYAPRRGPAGPRNIP